MSRIDIGWNILNPSVVPCTAEAFRTAMHQEATGRVCAELADLLEQHRRGQLKMEEYQARKTTLKKQLPFYTPHAHFAGGYKSGNHQPEDSDKVLLDCDDNGAGRQLYEQFLKGRERQLGINAVYDTASGNGFAVLFDKPQGLTRQQAQSWLAHQLGDVAYDKGVHDITRAAYIPAADHFHYLDPDLMFAADLHPAVLTADELRRWQQAVPAVTPPSRLIPLPPPVAPQLSPVAAPQSSPAVQVTTRMRYAFDETLAVVGLTLEQLNRPGVRHNTLRLLLPTLCQMMSQQELLAVLAERMPDYSKESDCRKLVSDFYEKYVDSARPLTQQQRDVFLRSLSIPAEADSAAEAADSPAKPNGQPAAQPLPVVARRSLPPALQASLRPYPDSFVMPHIVGLMPALMALADGVTVRYCDGKIHHLAGMAIIIAEQSSNKGTIVDDVELWIDSLRRDDDAVRRKEDAVKAKNKQRKQSERGEQEPTDVLRVPTITISCSKLLRRLKQAQGHTLYSICPEIDTLRKTNGASSWSAKYDIYRVAFDHDRWGQDFNSDQSESGEVEVGYNWTILGTPGSVAKCFKNDNTENGLSGRIMVSEMPDNLFAPMTVFKEMTEADRERIRQASEQLRQAHGFHDTPRLRKAIAQWLEEKRLEAAKACDRVKDTYRRRAGVIGFRCGVVYMLLCGKESNACCDFAVAMAEYVMQQQVKFFGPLLAKQMKEAQEEALLQSPNVNIFDQLPTPFALGDLRRLKGSEYADGTLYSIISRWKKEGWITKSGKNQWTKVQGN